MRYRLLALDLDGTILGPDGAPTPGVREAVDEARRRGVEVVVCTGRRLRTALPLARGLGLTGAIVVNNGVLVKDLESAETLHHRYLSSELYAEILALLRDTGPPLVYVDAYHQQTDILTERHHEQHPFQREYLADNSDWARVIDDLGGARRDDVIMLTMIGDAQTLSALRERARQAFGERIGMNWLASQQYRGQILEFLAPGSGKWQALRRVADTAGIAPEQIAAVGDDNNDVGMIRGAGFGIAMGNAVAAAKAAADTVVGSNAEAGVVEAIELVLAER